MRGWFFILVLGLGLAAGCGNDASPPGPDGTWRAPVRIGAVGGTGGWSRFLDLDLDGEGNAIVAWHAIDRDFFYARLGPLAWSRGGKDGSWSAPEILGTDARDVDLDVAPGGEALAVWDHDIGERGSEVLARRFTPGQGWGPASALSQPFGTSIGFESASCALDGQGNGMAIWAQSSILSILGRRLSAGAWQEPQLLYREGRSYFENFLRTAVQFDGQGRALAIWSGGRVYVKGTFFNLAQAWSRWFSGGSWGSPALVSPPAASEAPNEYAGINNVQNTFFKLAVNGQGQAVAGWLRATNLFASYAGTTPLEMRCAVFSPDTGWAPTQLAEHVLRPGSEHDNLYNRAPGAAIDEQGRAMVVWPSEGPLISFNHFAPGTGWQTGILAKLSVDDLDPWPDIAAVGADEFLAVWSQYDGPSLRIAYSQFKNGAWSPVAFLSTNEGPVGAARPKIAVNAAGQAVVVWQQSEPKADSSGGAEFTVWASRSAP